MPGKVDAVGFIIKSMVERDPSKRRVKPSLQALEDFDGVPLEDSSDDSDFQVQSDDNDLDSAASNVSSSPSSSSSSSSSDDEDDDDEEDNAAGTGKSGRNNAKIVNVNAGASSVRTTSACGDVNVMSHAELDASSAAAVKVCCVCLSDVSTGQNEVVECDNCHMTVHEDCYGVCDSILDDEPKKEQEVEKKEHREEHHHYNNTVELWFCEACRVDDSVDKQCELCPNSGGVLKRTDSGRWVHLVCALYVPGVAFIDVDRLESVTLFELTYSRWGAKQCQLCENTLFARTGVTLQCDAGMCKVAFHATCAQRHGLLEEVRHAEGSSSPNVADPYFAHCRAHADKSAVRTRKRNYLAMQHRLRVMGNVSRCGDVQRQLANARAAVVKATAARSPHWLPTMKLGRSVASSVLLARVLLRRAELSGYDVTSMTAMAANDESTAATSAGSGATGGRKWLLPPAFSGEFVAYFCERRGRIESDRNRLRQLHSEQMALAQRRARLTSSHAGVEQRLAAVRQMAALLRQETEVLYAALSRVAGKRLAVPALAATTAAPSTTQFEHHASADLSVCGECSEPADVRMCAVCDSCGHCFHLQCLRPPLIRVPCRSRNAVWQCWRCNESATLERDEDEAALMQHALVSGKRQRAPPKLFQSGSPPQRRRRSRFSRSATAELVSGSKPDAAKSCEPVLDQQTLSHGEPGSVTAGDKSLSPRGVSRRARVPRRVYSPPSRGPRASSATVSPAAADDDCTHQMALSSHNDADRQAIAASSGKRFQLHPKPARVENRSSSEWSDGEGLSGDKDVMSRPVAKVGAKRQRGRPRLAHGSDRQWFPTSQWAPQKRKRRPHVPSVHLELQQKEDYW